SIEYRTRDGFNGDKGTSFSDVPPFQGLQIREVVEKKGRSASYEAGTVATMHVPLEEGGGGAYYDPVGKFGVSATAWGDYAYVTICGITNACPQWVLDTNPWNANTQ